MKKAAAAVTTILAAVVGLLLILPTLISTDWARTELSRQLSSASGMDISLGGPVRLSFLPSLAVVARDISITSETGDLSAKVPEFSTAITLSSLWSDKLEIQSIALVDPAIGIHSTAAGGNAEPAPSDQAANDPFASLVGTLERLAVNRITIENGSLSTADGTGATSTVSAIDVDLKAPDLDREATFSLAATQDGRHLQLDGTLSALRPILQRQPAKIALEAKMEPAPSPLLSSLKASGEIRLNANGGYQIQGGQFDLADQSFQLDALFQPGKRHRFLADLTAKRIDIGALANAGNGNGTGDAESSGEPSLAMLSGIDADISVAVEQLVSGALAASDVQLAATLRNGRLEADLQHLGLDAGSITASVSTDVTKAAPTFQGKLTSSGLDIGAMAKLVGQSAPLSGKMTLDTAFAFRGLNVGKMRESLNLRGTIGLRQAKVPLAALTGQKGGDISGLSLDAKIQDIAKPVDVAGKLTWQGQEVAFQTQLAPADFLASPSIAEASGPINLAVTSKLLRASANGTVGAGGTFKGQISAATPSLGKLLQWLGQGDTGGLQAFDFKGTVDAGPQGVSFTQANIALNGVKATGDGAVKLGTPLNIRTALQFATLDFAALAGEGKAKVDGKQGSAADAPIDLSFLKGLDARIDVAADKIGYGKVFAGPVKTTLVVAGGTADLSVPQSPFYGGTIAAKMSANGSGDVPAIQLEMAIAGATAAALLRDAAGFDKLEGQLNTNVAVSGAGKTTKTLRRSLGGNASVKLSDGALRGINIAEVYNNLAGLLSSGFKPDDGKKTTFTELGASFAIENGVAQTQDISLLGPLVRMDGAGKIDLAELTLAINLNPRVVASLDGQGGDIATKGIGVPVIVDGSLSAPRIYPDLRKLLQDPKGALEMLDRLGLPTGKLNLDKLLPGGTGGGNGAGDLIGDLIKGGSKDKGNGSGLADIINGALPGQQPEQEIPDQNATPQQPEGTAQGEAAQPETDQAAPEAPAKDKIGTILDQILR